MTSELSARGLSAVEAHAAIREAVHRLGGRSEPIYTSGLRPGRLGTSIAGEALYVPR